MATALKTRDRLIDEAARLVLTKGFNSTSINDVVDAVGIKNGTLYNYSSGKDELGLAVLEKARKNFFSFVGECLWGNAENGKIS